MKRFTLSPGLAFIGLVGLMYAHFSVAAEHSPTLDQVIARTPTGEQIPVILYLNSRVTMDDVYPAARALPMDKRRTYVVETLKKRFNDMSGKLMPRLEQAKKEGQAGILRPLWILNAVRVHGTAELIAEIDRNFPERLHRIGMQDTSHFVNRGRNLRKR